MRFWQDITSTLKLTIPIVLGQSIPLLMHLVDVMMIGRLGVTELAANGFATSLVSFFLVCGMGLCSSVQVEVSQAHGKGDDRACFNGLKHGLLISTIYGAFWSGVVFFIFDWSYLLGQPEEVVAASRSFVILLTLSAVPVYAFQCLKNYYEARQAPWTPLWLRAAGLLLNIFLNWLFIFGNWGFPAMGVAGAGLATLCVRVILLLVLCVLIFKQPWLQTLSLRLFDWLHFSREGISRALNIGVPAAIHAFFSMGMYSVAGLMFGWLGGDTIAASNIVMRYANFMLMIPLGTSFAATVQVGNAVGIGQWKWARRRGWICIFGCTLLMVVCAVLTFSLRGMLPVLFTADTELTALTTVYFGIAAWIQVADGLQFSALGALRGFADVKLPALIGFIGYWCVALTAAYVFAFMFEMGGNGIWLGLFTGLAVTSLSLVVRFHLISQRHCQQWVNKSSAML